jgi:hypothetical protein
VQTWLQKRRKKKRKREMGKDVRTLIRSDLTIFNLIFYGPERTEEKWDLWIHPSNLVPAKLTSTVWINTNK